MLTKFASKKFTKKLPSPYLCNPSLKNSVVLLKEIENHTKSGNIPENKFGRNNWTLTFALPFKNGVAVNGQKIFESLEATARKSYDLQQGKSLEYIRFDSLIYPMR